MKLKFIIPLLLVILTVLPLTGQVTAEPEQFVVIELFTSQGCSSCPSADEFLVSLLNSDKYKNSNVVAVAEHVTYWDYLGWPDLYGQKKFGNRQSDYVRAFGQTTRYTPQYFLSGEVIPLLNTNDIVSNIDALLGRAAVAGVKIAVNGDPYADNIEIEYDIVGVDPGKNLVLAIIENGLEDFIARGENANKILNYERVCRVFETVALTESHGIHSLQVPANVDMHNAMIVAMVQEPQNMRILAATNGVSVNELAADGPIIEVDKNILNFGTVLGGQPENIPVEISNTGNQPLIVNSIEFVPAVNMFSIGETLFPLTIGAGEKYEVNIICNPDKEEIFIDDIYINSNAVNIQAKNIEVLAEATVPKAVIASDMSSVFFSKTEIGESTSKEITISNSGTAELQISEINLVHDDEPGFFINDISLPVNLEPSGELFLEVEFRPSEAIVYKSDLILTSNATNSPEYSISMRGSGKAPAGVDEELMKMTGLRIFPNPASDLAFVSYSIQITGKLSIRLFDVLGNEVELIRNSITAPGEYSDEIPLHELAEGNYQLVFRLGNRFISREIVILK